MYLLTIEPHRPVGVEKLGSPETDPFGESADQITSLLPYQVSKLVLPSLLTLVIAPKPPSYPFLRRFPSPYQAHKALNIRGLFCKSN